MRHRTSCGIILLLASATALTFPPVREKPAPAAPLSAREPEAVGLSLFFQGGSSTPIAIVGEAPRYLQEVDIVYTTSPSEVDEGILPLIREGEFSTLDWSGVQLVEEDWRDSGDGTYQRQRFYRGAAWMEEDSRFWVVPTDASGRVVGLPITARAGRDDRWVPPDDGFVRRFVARQVASGCPSIGDCTGARYSVQALVQLRNALHPEHAIRIPSSARALRLAWSAQPGVYRAVEVTHRDADGLPFGYGFEVELEADAPPADGVAYLPGETVPIRVTFRDGEGNRLHPEGSLPTYGQFLRGEIASGLRYFDGFRLNPTTYYALKHRESNITLTLSGPTDRLKTPMEAVDPLDLLAGQATVATPEVDGFSAVSTTVPPPANLLGGLFDPTLWEAPVPDLYHITIPDEAPPGTYLVSIKARREFAGEALNRGETLAIPVGTATATVFEPSTGGCLTCHAGPSRLGSVLHGLGDRRSCFGCHGPLTVEPDSPLDIRVHMVHSRSDRFRSVGGDIRDCRLGHLTQPDGPFRNSGADGVATAPP